MHLLRSAFKTPRDIRKSLLILRLQVAKTSSHQVETRQRYLKNKHTLTRLFFLSTNKHELAQIISVRLVSISGLKNIQLTINN